MVGLTIKAALDFKCSEFMPITPKPITRIYFDTNLSMFGLTGLPMVAILEFKFSYLEHQNPSTGVDFSSFSSENTSIDIARWCCQSG